MTDLPDKNNISAWRIHNESKLSFKYTMPRKKGTSTGMTKSSTGLHHHGFAKGGHVKRTGKYLLHKGEQVLTPAKVKAMKQIAGFAMSGKVNRKNAAATAKRRASAFVKGKKRKACGCKRK
jgi:hypothetical protein